MTGAKMTGFKTELCMYCKLSMVLYSVCDLPLSLFQQIANVLQISGKFAFHFFYVTYNIQTVNMATGNDFHYDVRINPENK